jgi:hypothetical protein
MVAPLSTLLVCWLVWLGSGHEWRLWRNSNWLQAAVKTVFTRLLRPLTLESHIDRVQRFAAEVTAGVPALMAFMMRNSTPN